MEKSFVLDFNEWVSKKFKQQTSGEDINPQTKEELPTSIYINPEEYISIMPPRTANSPGSVTNEFRIYPNS